MSQTESPTNPIDSAKQTASSARRPLVRLSNWQIILILLVIVGGRLIIDFSQRIIEGQQKLAEQRELEQEIERLQAERIRLEAERIYFSSRAYIEAWAHDQGKMVRNGEILVIPVYEVTQGDIATDPQPSSPPQASPVQSSSWQVWWTMFFDSPPPFRRPVTQ